MQNWMTAIFLAVLLGTPVLLRAQYAEQDTTKHDFFIGSTLFVLYNLVPDDNSPDFVQLNFGYWFSPKDALSVELKTWKYAWSLGIPYGNSWEAPEEKFPGYIREYGMALAYQHFWWKGLYTGIHVMNTWQTFKNEQKETIGNGFQLFNTYRLGYHLRFFSDRFFIEPSIAATHRPYHSEMPESFKQLDDKWSKLFLGEPGLHFGFIF